METPKSELSTFVNQNSVKIKGIDVVKWKKNANKFFVF